MFDIQIIHGPNLNMLGLREPEIYGHQTLDSINEELRDLAQQLGVRVSFFQSNSEGSLVDCIQATLNQKHGLLINPGAYYPYQCGFERCDRSRRPAHGRGSPQ